MFAERLNYIKYFKSNKLYVLKSTFDLQFNENVKF